jgi:hypothetical protein
MIDDITTRLSAMSEAMYMDRDQDEIDALLLEAKGEIKRLREALKPFAKAGQVIDSPFGPALFREDDMAFQSGCAWSENGERRTITWGDFRRARAALIPQQKGNADGK